MLFSKGKEVEVCVMDSSEIAVGLPVSKREEALYAWAEGVMKRGKTQQQQTPSQLHSSLNGMGANELWTVAEAVLSSAVVSSMNNVMNGMTTAVAAVDTRATNDSIINNLMGENKTCKAVEVLIALAVSDSCANRHDFISVILESPNDIVRAELKAVIEESTALVASISDSERTPPSLKQGAPACKSSDADQVSAQLLSTLERESLLIKEVERLRRTCEASIVRVELDRIEAEDELHVGLDAELDQLRQELRKVRRRNDHLEPLAEEVIALRDEIDCLRPLNASLTKSEAALSKCRQRLEEQADLQVQLKLEEDAHAKVLARCLELETEATAVPQLRKQLEANRRDKAAMEFQMLELRIELDDTKASAKEASHAVRQLAQGSERLRSEAELARSECLGDNFVSTSVTEGLGCGTCELNPELAEELARLRRDNQCLRESLDRIALERVHALEEEVEDSKQLANKSVSELLSTRKDLERAKNEISKVRNENKQLIDLSQLDGDRLRCQIEDLAGLLLRNLELTQQKLCKLECTHVGILNNITKEYESSIAEEKLRHENMKRKWNDSFKKARHDHKSECERLERECNQATENLDKQNALNVESINIRHKHAMEEASLRHADELQRISEAYSTQIEKMDSMHISQLEVLNRGHTQEMDTINSDLKVEQEKVERLQSTIHELEQAQLKLSREKRLLWEEAEEYRCLIGGGGKSGGGISVAAHESLRCEFCDLLEENKSLRDQCRKDDVRRPIGSALGTYNTTNNNYHDVIEEYECRIQQLIQDKRDAIMKYNVVSSDAAQVELRLRQLILENQKNKSRATAAELRCERLARQFQQQPLEDIGPHNSSSSPLLAHDKENMSRMSSLKPLPKQDFLDKNIFLDDAPSATECKQS